MIGLWLTWTALANCDKPAQVSDLVRKSDAAIEAFVEQDYEKGRERIRAAEDTLACVDVPIGKSDAARLHLAFALSADHAGDAKGALAGMAAAHDLDGELLASVDLGDDYAMLVEAGMIQRPAALTAFSTSLAATVHVDGEIRAARHVGRPFVVQVFRADGGVVGASWVAAGEPVPEWVASPPVECEDQVPVDDLVAAVADAEASYANLDVEGFERSLQAIAVGLPCADGVVQQSQAAAIHRLEGIRQYVRNNPSQAIRAFQEAHALDPGYTPSQATVPDGSTLANLWERARTQPGSPWVSTEVPEDVLLIVDGLPSSARPAALPSIVQISSNSGWILWTRFVPPGGSLPDLEGFQEQAVAIERDLLPPARAVYQKAEAQRLRRNRRAGFAISSAVAMTGAATLYLVNTSVVAQYESGRKQYDVRPTLRRQANVSAVGGTVLLVGGVGLGVAAALVR